jgi:hypothetical protein
MPASQRVYGMCCTCTHLRIYKVRTHCALQTDRSRHPLCMIVTYQTAALDALYTPIHVQLTYIVYSSLRPALPQCT